MDDVMKNIFTSGYKERRPASNDVISFKIYAMDEIIFNQKYDQIFVKKNQTFVLRGKLKISLRHIIAHINLILYIQNLLQYCLLVAVYMHYNTFMRFSQTELTKI